MNDNNNNNKNNKNINTDSQMEKMVQECISCKTKVSEKIFYQWCDPSDNVYGFRYIKSHYRIFGICTTRYPVKIEIDNIHTYLYYKVLCVDCAKTYNNKWQCIYCNKYYDDTVTNVNKKRICRYCIKRGVVA